MSEIEKMYENAEVKKQIPKVCSSNELYCKECIAHIENAMPYCKKEEYPPFTAEKQLELIKWLMHKASFHAFFTELETDSNVYVINYCTVQYHHYKFESALSALITDIWQDLTEQERTEIAEILRG